MKILQKVSLTSSDLSVQKKEELKRILPEAFSENGIDWDKLRAVLGGKIDAGVEKFNFMWAGKSNAIRNVLMPSKLTLKPAKNESIKWDETDNVFIEGDNLEALKLLQKAYFEKVKMIYIDPPYNTGGDFVYHDDFASPLKNYLEQTGQTGEGMSLSANRETNGRYHSDWLSMMYPRLKLAWNLLKEDGVIFVSIDYNEAHHLRMLLDEIFGEDNFISEIIWEKRYTRSNNAKMFATLTEKIFLYRKSDLLSFIKEQRGEKTDSIYSNPDNDPRGVWTSVSYVNPATKAERPNLSYELLNPITGQAVVHPTNAWKYSKEVYLQHVKENKLYWGKEGKNTYPRLKKFLSELEGGMVPVDLWKHESTGTTDMASKELEKIMGGKYFDFPKPITLIQRMLRLITSDDDLILDFFAGSATTAHAVLEQNKNDGGNREFILIQLPETTDEKSEAYKAGYKTIAEIGKERIRRVIKGYGDNPQPINAGFKVFKLDKSNYIENNFEFDPEKSEEENAAAFNNYLEKAKEQGLFEKADDLDVVYENIVKEGLPLNSKIEKIVLGSNKIYQVSGENQSLLVCLDKEITDEAIKLLTGEEYKDKLFICLDNAMDDSSKGNLVLNLELKTI